jgi:hypothetical protein
MREIRNAYKVLIGEPEGRKPLGKPRRRWKGDTRMDVWEMGWEGVNWIHVAQDRNR